mgnify:CR=1 FL=1
MRVNAMTEQFEDVTVLGHPMIFTCLRVDRDTVPEGLYMYEVRHDDDQQGDPVQIGNWIMVNHWGTIISNKPTDWSQAQTGIMPTGILTQKRTGTMKELSQR